MRVSKNWVKFNKMFTLSPWASQEESEEIVPPNNVIWLVERVKDK